MRFTALVPVAVLALAACDNSSTVTAPTLTPPLVGPSVPVVGASLIVTIVEWTPQGERPLSGAYVWAQVSLQDDPPPGGRLLSKFRADEFGRVELLGLPTGARLHVMAFKEGYFQQCAQEITGGETPDLNLPLIPAANVSAAKDSVPPSRPGFRVVTGVVYERTTDGPRAIVNRLVAYDGVGLDEAAWTRTDKQGRFLICGLPQSRTVSIGADVGPRDGRRWGMSRPLLKLGGGSGDILRDVLH